MSDKKRDIDYRKIVFGAVGLMSVNQVFNRLVRDPEFNSEDFLSFQKLVNRIVDLDLETLKGEK